MFLWLIRNLGLPAQKVTVQLVTTVADSSDLSWIACCPMLGWKFCMTTLKTKLNSQPLLTSSLQLCAWWSQPPSTRIRKTAFTRATSSRAPTAPPTSWPGSASPWRSSAASCTWSWESANERSGLGAKAKTDNLTRKKQQLGNTWTEIILSKGLKQQNSSFV